MSEIERLIAEFEAAVREQCTQEYQWLDVDKTRAALLAAYPRWISVSERLPEENEKALTWNAETGYQRYDVISYFLQNGEPVWMDDEYSRDVTHWMPLPSGPEAKP
jgi:hypothetical protein